ncbi:MAG: magnesium transporter CorA family protein [Acidimicrobiia bacterium]|nr:magnesium transporter CorA family protein [Acidimicrobiia bacterium]
MHLRYVTPSAVEVGGADDLVRWRHRSDGFLWLHLDGWDDEAAALLRNEFGCHPQAIAACGQRTHLPTFHGYPDHWFVVVHRPLIGRAGHVHLLQIEQFIRDDALITLRGPHNPDIDPQQVDRHTEELRTRLDAGRLHPKSPSELSHALVSGLAREHRTVLDALAGRASALEQDVMRDDLRHPEQLLERMFLLRHELVTLRTMAGNTHEVFGRMAGVAGTPTFDDRDLMADLSDRFERVRHIGDSEREFVAGVIDYYQTKTATKMTVAMERLAVLAAVTLPITALASIYGMNVIVNGSTHWGHLAAALAAMALISGLLLRWTKRQGWW